MCDLSGLKHMKENWGKFYLENSYDHVPIFVERCNEKNICIV